jgi:hypothetical protein
VPFLVLLPLTSTPKLLDVAGAMESLPGLPLVVGEVGESVALKATGTDDSAFRQLVPNLAPTTGKTSKLQSILDKVTAETGKKETAEPIAVSA